MAIPFRFQPLLDYRQRRVDERQLAMAAAQRQLAAAESHLARLQADRTRFVEELRPFMSGILHVDKIERQYRYLATLERNIQLQQAALEAATEAVETARAHLEAAMKACKTLEKLKEYDEQNHRETMHQHEARAMDDFNIGRYSRGQQGEE